MIPPPDNRAAVVRGTGSELDALFPEWTALAQASGRTFYSRPWYSLAWWSKLGRGELAVCCLRRGGRLVALAPLHRRRLAGQHVLRLLGHGLGTIGEVLAVDDAAAASLWDVVAEEAAPLQLKHVRPSDPAILALRRHPRWRHHIEIDDRCPLLHLPPGSTSRQVRSARTLRRLASYRTGLARAGSPFRVEVVDDLPGLNRRWPDMVRAAALADAESGRLNLLAPPWQAFTRTLLEREASNGTLLVFGGIVGERWVAHEIGFRHTSATVLWLSHYEPALAAHSPGHLLEEWMVDHHDELGIDTMDGLLGENSFKLSWANDGYDVATVTAATAGLVLCRARIAAVSTLAAATRRGAGRIRRIESGGSTHASS